MKNELSFWVNEIEIELGRLQDIIEETIELYPEAGKFSLEDLINQRIATLKEDDLLGMYTVEEDDYDFEKNGNHFTYKYLYEAGQKNGFKTLRTSYLGYCSALKRLVAKGPLEKDRQKLIEMDRNIQEAFTDIVGFQSILINLMGEEDF